MNGVRNVERLILCAATFEVLSLCCESVPLFNNLRTLVVHSEECRGWQAMPVLLRNCPHLQTLTTESLVHHVTDKCGDACDCIYRKDKGPRARVLPSKRVSDYRVYRDNEGGEHDRAFLGLFSVFEGGEVLY